MYKIIVLFSLAIFFSCCSLSSNAVPTTETYPAPFLGIQQKNNQTIIDIPVPHSYTFKFDGEWEVKQNILSVKKNLVAFTLLQKNEEIQLRAMNRIDLYHDTTFTIEKDASEEDFIHYYLQWDQDYWAQRDEIIQQGCVDGPTFNTSKNYGTIKTVNGNYQRCVFAALDSGAIYMMTGTAIGIDKDICETEAAVWDNRKPFYKTF